MSLIEISLIVPVYNEELNIEYFMKRVETVLTKLSLTYEIIFINDGSTDNSLEKILKLHEKNTNIKLINLSRNFGKESALTAGLDFTNGNIIIPIDADLQHPPEIIPEMLKHWENGYDVVLCERNDRKIDNKLSAYLANKFYKIHNKIAEPKIPPNVGDFRLMDKKVVDALKLLPERRRFMKGLFAWLGFKSITIKYEVDQRHNGKSSFNGWKLWNFALEGITSFSTVPLHIWSYIGTCITLTSLLYAIYIVIKTLYFGTDLPGYPSLFTAILFFGGIQLLSIGILGEYIGRIYSEVKQRPIYIIKDKFGFKETNEEK